ncbi:MAG TPA: NosD domain-containing protein [Dehalococcoidia bacterium]|nr:NosD domain-containing protein [Dehalococcoidia bacterium]
MKKRLSAAIALLLVVSLSGRAVFRVRAAPSDFTISSLNCSQPLGDVFITTSASGNPPLVDLAVVITPPGGTPTTLPVDSVITPAGAYSVTTNATVDLQVGTGATQAPTPANNPIQNGDKIALSTSSLLTTGTKVDLISLAAPTTIISTQTCTGGLGTNVILTVDPKGNDFLDAAQTIPNTVCSASAPTGGIPTPTDPGPCATVENAVRYTPPGGFVVVDAGFYEVCHTIEITRPIYITSRVAKSGTSGRTFFAPTPGTDAFTLPVLHSFFGQTIFHVTSIGLPDETTPTVPGNTVNNNQPPNTRLQPSGHTAIDGLTLGGAFQPGNAAVFLDNDGYTSVSNNILGGDVFNNASFTGAPCTQPTPFPPASFNPPPVAKQETMGNSVGILFASSDHPNIFGNDIQGNAQFKFSPTLASGDVKSGFGITSTECLGAGADATNAATIAVNAISRNVNAGVWLCSDGGGGHLISQNILQSNGRGIVLRAITGSLLDTNIVSDDYADGIVVYDSASNNTIQKNIVESHRTPGAAGIRLGGFGGSLFPLQTAIYNNTLRRNYTDLVIAGARNTIANANVITAEDVRTAVFIQVGSTGSPDITQPAGTQINLNQVVSNGPCSATQGCAIRLDQFVTANVDATNNNFGLPPGSDVNSVLWHKPNDPSLGFINANQSTTGSLQPGALPTATQVGAPGAVGSSLVAVPSAAASTTTGAPATGATPAPGASPGARPAVSGTPFTLPAGASATPAIAGTSPVLTSGPAGGTTQYQPPCAYITVPASIGGPLDSGRFLSLFQPVSNIFSAFRIDNATHAFQALYFSNSQAPVDVTTVRPGDIVALCLTDTVTGPP